MSQEQKQSRFQAWYERNKKTFNRARQHRYNHDKAFRAQAQERAARYRKARAEGSASDSTESLTVSQVATSLGVKASWIGKQERQGNIPAPTLPGLRRRYTHAQALLIGEWQHHCRHWRRRKREPAYAPNRARMLAYIRGHWEK